MNVNVNPFSYNSNDTSAYNYKRLDPSAFWNPSFNYGRRVKKKRPKEESIKKVVRNVKDLPDHLIGRFKHGKENGRKTKDALNFGRGGHGAPLRTKSGRLKSTMIGNPEIRFQANESVQRSISNSIRYAADKQEKSEYHNQLEQQIRDKNDQLSKQKEDNFSMTKLMQEIEGTQWGRPGPGGTYWRPSAITGQGFYDKMGWMTADDPRKRQPGIKAGEAEAIKVEMSELARKRNMEHKEIMSEIGTELAPLLGSAVTGKPRKDPETGYMMNHSLGTTDVTRLAVKGHQMNSGSGVRGVYNTQLRGQVAERAEDEMRERERDSAQQSQHFQSWDTFWGRPGYGAPRDSTQRENLMKNLYFAENGKKTPGNVELITLERLPVKF